MFDDINNVYIVLLVAGVAFIYLMVRFWKPKVWISVSAPGKSLRDVGFMEEGESVDLVEMRLINEDTKKPVVRMKSEDDDQSVAWVINGDIDDDANVSDYRMCGYITSEGLIYKQRLKTSKPVLVGYTAREKHPETPTTKGKRSWENLWLDSKLCVFEGDPSNFNPNEPMKRRVGFVRLSGISFHNKGPVTLEAKSGASAFFYNKYGPKVERDTIYKEAAYGWNDTALLTSIIYSVLFLILYYVYTSILKKPLLGDDYIAMFVLIGFYYVLWAVIRQIKINCIERSCSFQPLLDMLNKGLGLKKFDSTILLFCTIAVYLAKNYYDYDLIPLIFAISFGISKNALTKSTKRPWKIMTNYNDEQDLEEEENSLPSFSSIEIPRGEMVRMYDWDLDSLNGVKLHGNLAIHFSMDEYNKMRNENPYFSQRLEKTKYEYVSDMFIKMLSDKSYMERVRYIASYIQNESIHANLDEMDSLQFVLDFVQEPNIDFVMDKDSKSIQFAPEYVRYPDETLYDQEGDSDCKAMLVAMILYSLGYNVLYLSSEKKQHSAIAVETKSHPWLMDYLRDSIIKKNITIEMNHHVYIYCEVTGDGYQVGDMVEDMRIDDFETRVEFLQVSDTDDLDDND